MLLSRIKPFNWKSSKSDWPNLLLYELSLSYSIKFYLCMNEKYLMTNVTKKAMLKGKSCLNTLTVRNTTRYWNYNNSGVIVYTFQYYRRLLVGTYRFSVMFEMMMMERTSHIHSLNFLLWIGLSYNRLMKKLTI